MPASEIMKKFREGKLHHGKSKRIVKRKEVAEAIKMSYLRKEGKLKD